MEKKTTTWATLLFTIIFAILSFTTNASDPDPLQDFCVSIDDPLSQVFVNGKFCKNPTKVTTEDFLYKGFNISADIDNPQGAVVTMVNVNKLPGLNTQGISIARVDFAPFGLNAPHEHPRATELFTVIKGRLYAGFVTTDNKLFATTLNEGDVIVFPRSLIHFQINLGDTQAFGITAFTSQNPGRADFAKGLFGTTPKISVDVLVKTLQVDKEIVDKITSQFSSNNIHDI